MRRVCVTVTTGARGTYAAHTQKNSTRRDYYYYCCCCGVLRWCARYIDSRPQWWRLSYWQHRSRPTLDRELTGRWSHWWRYVDKESKFLIKLFAKILFFCVFCFKFPTKNSVKPSVVQISAVLDIWRVCWSISSKRWRPEATIDSWALQTIVDPTADDCPRSPYVYHVPWVLYLHLVLLSKNIFPVSEFAVNPSRLPHRTVADRRRTAQRVQERFQAIHRGAQERRLSAAIIGSDHVNFGHGEYTVGGCDSLLFDYLVDGPCLHCVPKFFSFEPFASASHRCRLRISLLVFNIFRHNFIRPDRFSRSPLAFITFAAAPPKSIINVQTVPLRSPNPSNLSPFLDSAVFELSWSSKPSFTIFLHRF